MKEDSSISTSSITKSIEEGIYPNMYPNEQFVLQHRKLLADYAHEIRAYKTFCFKELNTYYKTGEVVVQDCTEHHLTGAISKAGKTGLSLEEQIIFVAKRLEELWNKVVPLDHDIIVYRGIRGGTIGQNLFTGKCIKSRMYTLDMHRFCTDEDLEDPRFWDDRKQNEDPRLYICETLGFTSVTTDINIAHRFADLINDDHDIYDTIMALKLPAGTKFLLPLSEDGKLDPESELILFPQQSTYVLTNIAFDKKVPIYIGTFCNDLNVYRPIGSPKLRNLRVKHLYPEKWHNSYMEDHPLAFASDNDAVCPTYCSAKLHFCDPGTEKCLGDKPETLKKIQDWWRRKNIKGKCTAEKVNSCVDKFLACDPDTGDCIPGPYYDIEANKALNWATPETIKAEQKPRYDCTVDKISECANERKLCDPYKKGKCVAYDIHDLYWFNNGLPGEELEKFRPDGSCKAEDIKACSKDGLPCDPNMGYCMYNIRKHKWERVLSRQKALKGGQVI